MNDMSQTTVNLGYVPKNRGEYSSTASYYKDNIVQYNGSSYICNPPNYDPDTAPTASITGVAPYASDPAVPNTGWAVFCNDSSGVGEGVYDVSVDHTTDSQPKIYASLSAALQDVPQAKQKGGMSVKFIQGSAPSSDNTYVQYRLTKGEWSINTNDWERYNDITTSNRTNSDLDFSDEDGNVLVRFKDGHVKTKNFDSSKNATTEERGLMSSADKAKLDTIEEGAEVNSVETDDTGPSDLNFSDEQDNVLVRFANGHIKTKNFDSSKDATEHKRGLMSAEDKVSLNESVAKLSTVEEGAQVNDAITDDVEDVDLDFSDEQGNVLVRFEGGHIKTKNFDSSKEPQKDIILPTYWKNYFDSKIVTIQNKIKSLGTNGVTFGFVTDSHWGENYKQTPNLLRYIKQNTLIEDFINGGDVIVGVTTKDDAELQLKTFAEAYKNTNIVNIVGNHDLNTNLQTTWAQALSEGDFYYYLQRASEKDVVWEKGKLYGYRDNNSQKIRYIFLNSGYQTQTSGGDRWTIPNEEIEYLKARIVELPQGWGVIVFTHSYFTYEWSADPQGSGETGWTQHRSGLQVKNALDEIYDTVNATIIAVISGHTHRDMSEYSEKGYPCIAVSCDTYNYTSISQSYNVPKVQGTTTEQLFDLFFIDTQNRTIYDMRIGAGDTNNDRTFTY